LDLAKSQALLEILAGKRQVFMATAGAFSDMELKVKRFSVNKGVIREG